MTELGKKLIQIRCIAFHLRTLEVARKHARSEEEARRYQISASEEQRKQARLVGEVSSELLKERRIVLCFCQEYYIRGRDIKEVGSVIDRSPRQCERYKALVERGIRCRKNKEDKNHGKHQENDR